MLPVEYNWHGQGEYEDSNEGTQAPNTLHRVNKDKKTVHICLKSLTLPTKVDGAFSPFPTVVRAISPHQKLSMKVHFLKPSFSAK